MRTTSTTIASLGAAALLTLTGCADGAPGPAAQPPPGTAQPSTSTPASRTASPSTSTAPTPSRVDVPLPARAHTTEGAKAFATYWVESVGEGLLNGSSEQIRALSAPTCKGCQSMIEWADELAAKEQRVTVSPQSVLTSAVRPGSSSDLVVLDVIVAEAPYKILSADGRVVESSLGGRSSIRMSIRWDSRWIADQFDLVHA